MSLGAWTEALAIVAGLAASAFTLARLALRQQRAITERFVGFLEASVRRQDETLESFREAVTELKDTSRENGRVIERIARHLAVRFCEEEEERR